MSHFTVMVIGPNPEEQLALFHEFESTGINEFVESIDCTDKAREYYKKHAKEQESFLQFTEGWYGYYTINSLDELDIGDAHKFGYILLNENGEIEKVVKRTNPDAKWDWYVLGGRWDGFFKLKPLLKIEGPISSSIMNELGLTENKVSFLINLYRNDPDYFSKIIDKFGENKKKVNDAIVLLSGEEEEVKERPFRKGRVGETGLYGPSKENYIGRADQALKGDIDFESMRNDAAKNAAEKYDNLAKIFGGNIPSFKTWDEFSKEAKQEIQNLEKEDESINQKVIEKIWDKYREAYTSQDVFKILQNEIKHSDGKKRKELQYYFFELDNYVVPREKCIEREKNRAIMTFAILKDFTWYEKGKMGYWTIVTDEKDEETWEKEFNKIFDETDDNELISVFDCHI